MTRPLLLDVFSGAGGAAMGYHLAGFDVVGVDVAAQPRYPFAFVRGDAIAALADIASIESTIGRRVDAIHASPPCQRYATITRGLHGAAIADAHPDLVAPTRELLVASGRPWVIENVEGAPLVSPLRLCGTMFGLGAGDRYLRRHRLFETSFEILLAPGPCAHPRQQDAVGVYGNPGGSSSRDRRTFASSADWREAMEIDWMNVDELAEAIPPAYTRWLGAHLFAAVRAVTD